MFDRLLAFKNTYISLKRLMVFLNLLHTRNLLNAKYEYQKK